MVRRHAICRLLIVEPRTGHWRSFIYNFFVESKISNATRTVNVAEIYSKYMRKKKNFKIKCPNLSWTFDRNSTVLCSIEDKI